MTYRQALERLFELRRFGIRPGLERMHRLLAALGHPQRGLKAIHVTGSNGKGSTSAFAESLLRHGGVRTGLYTSPHLSRFTERIRVGGGEIEEDAAAELASRVFAIAEGATFFEVATAMALLAFHEAMVEVAVMEVGLGGRFDATNVLEAELVAVVTGVALEHTDVLGRDTASIAFEKAGIFRRGWPAVIGCDDAEAGAVLEAEARSRSSPLYRLGIELTADALAGGAGLHYQGPGGLLEAPRLSLDGAHQRRNAALALAATALLPGVALDQEARQRGLEATRWPGRLEWIADDVLLDGAHNPDGARVLAAELPRLARNRPVTLLAGFAADKDAAAFLALFQPEREPMLRRIIFTRPPSTRARAPEELLALAPGATALPQPSLALESARTLARAEGGMVLVSGSIFLVGEVRRLLTGERADPIVAQDPGPSLP